MKPDDPLTMTIHDLPQPGAQAVDDPNNARRRRAGRVKVLLVLLACTAPVVASYLTYFVIRPEGRTNYASLLTPARAWPGTLPLGDAAGAPVDPSVLKGQWLLVSMGDAACDADCERRLYTQRQLREMLGRDRDRIDKVFVVLDGAPLSAALTSALLTTPSTRLLRAPRTAVAAWLDVPATAVDQHLYIVDPMGQWMLKAPVDPQPAKLKRDLDRLLRASASWDRAGR